MKKLFEFKNAFAIYKKLPKICAVMFFVCSCIVGIIDSIVWFTLIGFCVFEAAFFIWLIIGAVGAFLCAFFTSALISPTVLRTEETFAISEKMTALYKKLESKE